MTVAINCTECGEEVVFRIDQNGTKKPTETCNGCGSIFQLTVRRVE